MKHIKLFENFLIKEGGIDYIPGYRSDTTSDYMYIIRKKTSLIVNEELKRIKEELFKENSDIYSKISWVNIALTALQDKFNIKNDLIDDCKKYINDILNYNFDSSDIDAESRKKYMKITLEELNNLKSNGDYYYNPGFMEKN